MVMMEKYGLEIYPQTEIGSGLYLVHAFNITISPDAILGRNVNLHKGVTIGRENRGPRMGAPKVGDCVWIGANATLVGQITIGSDVLVASNSFVNTDVPSHSVVVGSPCRIFRKEDATDGYVNSRV